MDKQPSLVAPYDDGRFIAKVQGTRWQMANAQANLLAELTDVTGQEMFSSKGGLNSNWAFRQDPNLIDLGNIGKGEGLGSGVMRDAPQRAARGTRRGGKFSRVLKLDHAIKLLKNPDFLNDLAIITSSLRGTENEVSHYAMETANKSRYNQKGFRALNKSSAGVGYGRRLTPQYEELLRSIKPTFEKIANDEQLIQQITDSQMGKTGALDLTPEQRASAHKAKEMKLKSVGNSASKVVNDIDAILDPANRTFLPKGMDRSAWIAATNAASKEGANFVDPLADTRKHPKEFKQYGDMKLRSGTKVGANTARDLKEAAQQVAGKTKSSVVTRIDDALGGFDEVKKYDAVTQKSQLTGGAGGGVKSRTILPGNYFGSSSARKTFSHMEPGSLVQGSSKTKVPKDLRYLVQGILNKQFSGIGIDELTSGDSFKVIEEAKKMNSQAIRDGSKDTAKQIKNSENFTFTRRSPHNKVYLNVPFNSKDLVKSKYFAQFDQGRKQWWVPFSTYFANRGNKELTQFVERGKSVKYFEKPITAKEASSSLQSGRHNPYTEYRPSQPKSGKATPAGYKGDWVRPSQGSGSFSGEHISSRMEPVAGQPRIKTVPLTVSANAPKVPRNVGLPMLDPHFTLPRANSARAVGEFFDEKRIASPSGAGSVTSQGVQGRAMEIDARTVARERAFTGTPKVPLTPQQVFAKNFFKGNPELLAKYEATLAQNAKKALKNEGFLAAQWGKVLKGKNLKMLIPALLLGGLFGTMGKNENGYS